MTLAQVVLICETDDEAHKKAEARAKNGASSSSSAARMGDAVALARMAGLRPTAE